MTEPRWDRRAAVVGALIAQGLDGLLVTLSANIRWLTGFSGSAGYLLVTARGTTVLVTDFRYETQAPEEVDGRVEVVIERNNVRERLARVIESCGLRNLGIEGHVLTVHECRRLEQLLPVPLTPVVDLVEEWRQVKDAGEVASIRAAADLAQEALERLLPTVRVGQTEHTVAARLEAELRGLGSEWHPFQTIVASGPRSALPHGRSSSRAIERGDLLLIDFGATVDGYCSDLTRVFVVGAPPTERQVTVHGIVAAAHRHACEQVRAGMAGHAIDALARDIIVDHGHGGDFGHSLGHGVGLEVHEMPRLAATVAALLPVGAVVTIEPGIYLPGWGGVRLEDDVWVTEQGPVLLSDGRTDLRILDH